MAKITLNDLTNLPGQPLSAQNIINNNSSKIEAALENTLSRDGTSPNQMLADFDLNHNDLLNAKELHADSLFINGTKVEVLELVDTSNFATSAQGAKADTALQPNTGAYRVQSFVAAPSTFIPIIVLRVYTETYNHAAPLKYSGAHYVRTSFEPSHALKFFNGSWWEIDESEISLFMAGSRGDYNPATRVGTDDTLTIRQAFQAAVAVNSSVKVPVGTFYNLGELQYLTNLRISGVNRLVSRFYIDITNIQAGGRFQGQNLVIRDLGHMIYLTGVVGSDGGEYGSGITFSQYFTDGVPVDTKNISITRMGFYAAPGSPNGPAHALNGIGRFSQVDAYDIEVDGFTGSAVHFHWGANGPGIGQAVVNTYHPNNLRVRHVVARNGGRLFTLSSCFDVQLSSLRGIALQRVGDILPGDETNTYAIAEHKPLVGSDIRVSDFCVDGLVNVGSAGSIRVISVATSRIDEDAPTVPTRRVMFFRGLTFENGVLQARDNITDTSVLRVVRAIDLTGATGDITLRNIDCTDVARFDTGLRLADCRGNIIVDNVALASATAIDLQRTTCAYFKNMMVVLKNRTGLAADPTALTVGGSEFSTTLSVAKAANDPTITVGTALGAVLNPGDTITVGGNSVKVAGSRQIRSTETVIPIEAMAFTASIGATVACDQRSVPNIESSTLELYDFGISLEGTRGSYIGKNKFVDIAKQGIKGAPKGGVIETNRFIRGGQHRLIDNTYLSRNIIMNAGAENVVIQNNDCGIEAQYIDMNIQTATDTGNLRVRNNALGNSISAHAQFLTQTNARLDAAQFNEYLGNYRKDGGQWTGATTWYEFLQNAIMRYHGTAAPTRGYHRAGSEWVHTSPAVGSPTGGMCTVSGTPGTWVNKANL